VSNNENKKLRVGELARVVGKSVRAIHLYEEMGLLTPVDRSQGGFRLFGEDAVARINWIGKLQVMGFSLSEIRDFIDQFEQNPHGRAATDRVRGVFAQKLADIRDTVSKLQTLERDLVEALAYLESCQTCEPSFPVTECGACGHHGHEVGEAPELFAGLSQKAREEVLIDAAHLIPGPHTGQHTGKN
jgi:DNA-binding transcriptional MerR regulator